MDEYLFIGGIKDGESLFLSSLPPSIKIQLPHKLELVPHHHPLPEYHLYTLRSIPTNPTTSYFYALCTLSTYAALQRLFSHYHPPK
jgi:hypothetical protein